MTEACVPEKRFARPPRMLRVEAQKPAGLFIVPTRAAQAGRERFAQFLESAVRELPLVSDPLVALVGALLVFEAPGSPADLPPMIRASLSLDLNSEPTLIYWSRNRMLHCRELSAQTRAILARLTDKASPYDGILHRACDQLAHWYPAPANANPSELIAWIVNDGIAWLSNELNQPLVADIFGAQRIEPLPAAVIDRARGSPNVVSVDSVDRRPGDALETLSTYVETGQLLNDGKEIGCWLIDDLLSALTERSRRPKVRRRAEADVVIRALARSARRLLEAGPAASFVYSFVLFMLSEGTARTTNGNLDTVRRYSRNLAHDLHRALVARRRNPLDLEEFDWLSVIRALCGSEPTEERRKAVSALLKFLRAHAGIDVHATAVEPHTTRNVHANVVWHHELVAALQMLSRAEPDERLRMQVRTIYDVARRAPVRFSEIILLEVRNVQVFTMGDHEYVGVELATRRGKTAAARRTVMLGKAAECDSLVQWLRRREAEGAQPDELLFADPHRPERLYRLGRVAQLVHGLLKFATGDSDVSFHTLRHTVLTSQIRQVLESRPHGDADALHVIAARAGHLQPATSLETYFHLPWRALRLQIDASIAPLLSHARVRRAWQGAALAGGWADSLPALPLLAADGLDQALPPDASNGKHCRTAESLTLEQTRHVLGDVCAGCTPAQVMSRNSLSENDLTRLCVAADPVANALTGGTPAKGLGFERRETVQLLSELAQSLKRVPADFSEPLLEVHANLWSKLDTVTSIQKAAVLAWTKCYAGGRIALRQPAEYEPLLKFLAAANVPASHLAIRTAQRQPGKVSRAVSECAPSARGSRLYQVAVDWSPYDEDFDPVNANACAHRLFGVVLPSEQVQSRRGRPGCYLLISRGVVVRDIETPSASCRMGEVHGAFVAAAARLMLHAQP